MTIEPLPLTESAPIKSPFWAAKSTSSPTFIFPAKLTLPRLMLSMEVFLRSINVFAPRVEF